MTPPKDKGLFIGNSHKNGGIPSKVKETGQLIEIEGDEYYICREAYNSSETYSFKNKTNKQVLESIYTKNSCKLNQSLMAAGDFIVCKLVVKDKQKRDREGSVKQILNEMQGEKSCKVENGGSSFKLGGKFRTITRKDGTKYDVKVYSDEELMQRANKKKDSLKNIAKNIKRLRSKVNSDLKSEDEKVFLTALAVYTMLETSERVGNSDSASNGHFGITGLKKNHVNTSGGKVSFKYKGKSGVDHDKTLSNSKLASLLSKAKSNSKSENIFETSNGFTIKNTKVNRYLKSLDVSAKDIRGYSANKWIISKLSRLKPDESDTKRKKQFNEVVKEVAAKVGHGAATLKKHYLLPELQAQWIEKGKVIDLTKFKDMKLAYGGAVKTEAQKAKVKTVMKEFKDKKLKTSHGKKVTDRKQAVAIALSEARREKKEQGGTINSGWFKDELSFLNW
jgi:DNA topoisomerase IB